MQPFNLLSTTGQIAAHLRDEAERGEVSGTMPGVNWLATELGVNRKTVEAALRQLEVEGLLVSQGPGRKRLIVLPGGQVQRSMRVAILVGEASDRKLDYMVELQHALMGAGHTAIFPAKTLMDIGMNVARVAQQVQRVGADAWVVCAASRQVLEWFSTQQVPAFALFGRRRGLSLAGAGPDKPPALAAAARQLIGLGHRRIVLLARRLRRLPQPGASERAFLDELEAHGVPVGDYNLPDWVETKEGLQQLLKSLFRVTPPTALIIQEAFLFAATQQFLAGRGIQVPHEVSLVCTDPNPTFAWCTPSIAHIRWDSRPIVRRIVRWAADVSRGRHDLRQTSVRAEFVSGGTIGPVPGARRILESDSTH